MVAGALRNSRIDVPDAPGLRPTPDRVRETLFNWLMPVIDGARCLDLFAGTGALGIEALSRGAGECVFVEQDAKLAAALRGTLERLKVANGHVRNEPAERFLASGGAPFDVAFVDPPFAAGLWRSSLSALDAGWLKPGGYVYVEAPVGHDRAVPSGWTLHRESRAGDVRYALYRPGVSGGEGVR
ncbi:MAG TPA: 16S rRNA (guanine(966)-N(2))-methyltransferase RsmD [Xanthomonadales bacterium]|nr:16S rRNA (guanine(966)-N(2))-methyltransferase RsmD [Xanthomonadales bacterium]